jgi:hypothetical protein
LNWPGRVAHPHLHAAKREARRGRHSKETGMFKSLTTLAGATASVAAAGAGAHCR